MNAPNQRRAVTAAMTGGLSLPQPPRISINNSSFSLIDRAGNELQCNLVDPNVGRYLDVVIVDANQNKSKIYWEEDWTGQDAPPPPACWSDNGVAPSQAAISPQATTCAICEHNEIGSKHSKKTGKPIKACQDRKKLACFVIGDPANELYQFQVTPAALKHLAAYGKWISKHPSQSNPGQAADVSEVVTRLYFLQGEQGVIGFGSVSGISPEMNARIDDAFARGLTAEIVGSDDVPISGLLAAPQPQAQIAPPQNQFAQVPNQPALAPPARPPQHTQSAAPPQPQAQPAFAMTAATPVAAQPAPQPTPVAPPGFAWDGQQWVAAPVAPPTPVAPPGYEWSTVAERWIPVGAQGQPTYGATVAAAPTYPAPQPGDDPYTVPAFLQRSPAPVSAAQVQPGGQPSQPQAQFTATVAPGAKSGRGGARKNAGRKPVEQPADFQQAPANAPAQPLQAPFQAPPPYQPPGQAQPAQPAPGPAPAPQFGMQQPGAPTADMTDALNRAFGAPLPPR